MELDVNLKKVLVKINFIERYQKLSNSFQFESPFFSNYENERVNELIKNFGHNAKHIKNENFFKIVDKELDFQFQFNISIKNGVVELIWDVLKNKNRLQLGGPWGMITKLIQDDYNRIKLPVFRSYEDLEAILKEAFNIYEDFKAELLKQETT